MAYVGRQPLAGEVILMNSIESQFNGTLTTFNLTRTVSGATLSFFPVSSEHLFVSLGGVIQQPDNTGNIGFRINYDQIIFAVAPPTGTKCFIIAYGNILDIGTPADGTVTPDKLSTGGPWWLTNGNFGVGTTNPQYKLEVNGSFAATTKSFLIPHPTKENYKLRHGSLEGPENGVYVRGRTSTNIIELPDYWTGLVDADSITVNLTPIGNRHIWVEEINNNKVYINSEDTIDCFYTVFAERKDVEKLIVEIEEN